MQIFNEIELYRRAAAFSETLSGITARFPPSTTYFADRVTRSARVIVDALDEGKRSSGDAEKKSFLWKAREGVWDCSGLLEVAQHQNLITLDKKLAFRLELYSFNQSLRALIHATSFELKPAAAVSSQ